SWPWCISSRRLEVGDGRQRAPAPAPRREASAGGAAQGVGAAATAHRWHLLLRRRAARRRRDGGAAVLSQPHLGGCRERDPGGDAVTIVEFLLARIAEDEATAFAAAAGPWEADGHEVLGEVHDSPIVDYIYEPDTAAHIARHDPKRVLAERAALRAIIER